VKGAYQACKSGAECGSGFCVDGVCCDAACAGPCEACNLPSAPGKCTVEPFGVDLRHKCAGSGSCSDTCDGTGKCAGTGKGSQCAPSRCTGTSTGTGPAYCASQGEACPTDGATEFDCRPYACSPAFGVCLSTCAGSDDCALGYTCDVAQRLCVASPQSANDGGGCSFALPSSGRGCAALAGAALAALAWTLRRRRRA
jgi:hypothetical protein